MMGTQGGKAQGSSSFLKAAGAEANHAAAAVGLTVSEPHCDRVPPAMTPLAPLLHTECLCWSS